MKSLDLQKIFTGAELDRLQEIARDLGASPEQTAVFLALTELDRNPSLSGTNRPEADHKNAEIFRFPSNRH